MEERSAPEARREAAALQEKVEMEEFVLQRLLDRRTKLSGELESTRIRRQRLIERKVLLQERKLHLRAQRAKDVALQKELKDSLAKSRDRLASLASLEEGKILEEKGRQLLNIENTSSGEPTQKDHGKSSGSGSIEENGVFGTRGSTIAEESVGDSDSAGEVKSSLLTSRSDVTLYDDAISVLRSNRHVEYPMIFLPALQGDLLKNILLLSLREANASDNRNDSTRRNFIWDTCLDLCMLSSNVSSPIEAGNKRDRALISSIRIDPNLPLCPYELAGVCADDLCPYQHATKPTLARECIPLPPLAFLESMPVRHAETEALRKEEMQNLKKPIVLDGRTDQPQEGISNELSLEANISMDEDFIELPEAEPENEDGNEMEIETKDEMESTLKLDGSDFAGLNLWWGGLIDSKSFTIRNIINDMHDEITERQDSNALCFLGGIVDMVRLGLHAGRFDIVMSLCKQSEKYCPRPQWFRDVQAAIQESTTISARKEKLEPRCFCQTLFAEQATLAILSHSLESVRNAGGAHQTASSILSEAMACYKSAPFSSNWKSSSLLDFDISKFRKMLHLEVSSGESVQQRTLAQLKKLKINLHWARNWSGILNFNQSPQEIESKFLKPCWTVMSSWFEALARGNRTWDCVRATIFIGEIVLRLLEKFVIQIYDDGLDANLTAALIAVDATVSQIAKGLCKELSDIPMIDVLVTPLFSCSITISTFLRNYKISQNRLEYLLASDSRRFNEAMLITQFSEVLWSQLFQLRMALISESSDEERNSKKNQPKSKISKFPWEPSKDIVEDNQRLVEIVSKLGVRLCHISLKGDWILASVINSEVLPTSSHLSRAEVKSLRRAAYGVLRTLFADSKGTDLQNTQTILNLRNVPLTAPKDLRGRTLSHFISALPSSFLLAGHKMLSVCLAGCHLNSLPASFGIYFPNLTTLDLSKNGLQTLPSSFSGMACLESLILCHNLLKDLSGEEFVASLKSLDLSHNSLTCISPDFVAALNHRCFQLENFNLAENNISGLEELEFLQKVAVPQWTIRMKFLRLMTWLPQTKL